MFRVCCRKPNPVLSYSRRSLTADFIQTIRITRGVCFRGMLRGMVRGIFQGMFRGVFQRPTPLQDQKWKTPQQKKQTDRPV